MSDGGIEKGYTFWATIKITKQGMSKSALQGAMNEIREILAKAGGDVVHCAQYDSQNPHILAEMRQSPKYRKKKKKNTDGDE